MSEASSRKPRLRRFLAVAGVAFLGLAIGIAIPTGLFGLVTLAVHGVLFDDPFNDRDFDRDLWIAHAHDWDDDNPRGQMVYDLRGRLLLERPHRQDVIELLGPPDWPSQPSSDGIAYILGMWSGFRVDHDSLRIYFAADGRVADVKTIQH